MALIKIFGIRQCWYTVRSWPIFISIESSQQNFHTISDKQEFLLRKSLTQKEFKHTLKQSNFNRAKNQKFQAKIDNTTIYQEKPII